MSEHEAEITNHLTAVQAEAEAQSWYEVNLDRMNVFKTRRLAALAMSDSDPFADDDFADAEAA